MMCTWICGNRPSRITYATHAHFVFVHTYPLVFISLRFVFNCLIGLLAGVAFGMAGLGLVCLSACQPVAEACGSVKEITLFNK